MPVAVVNSGVWLCVWHFKSCSSCTWHPIRWVGTRGGGEKGKELHLWNVGGLILKGPIWIHHNGFQVIFGYQTLQLNQKMVKDGDYKTASLLIAVEIRNPSTNKSWYLWIQWEVREISIYFQNLHLCIQCIYIYIYNIDTARYRNYIPLEGTCVQEIQRILICDQTHHCELLLQYYQPCSQRIKVSKLIGRRRRKTSFFPESDQQCFAKTKHILTYCLGGLSSLHSLKLTFCP